nr:aldo/keto reductase [Rhizobium sp. Pop5]
MRLRRRSGTAVAILNAYTGAGGNFIATADVYHFGQSEEILGNAREGGARISRLRPSSPMGRHRTPTGW